MTTYLCDLCKKEVKKQDELKQLFVSTYEKNHNQPRKIYFRKEVCSTCRQIIETNLPAVIGSLIKSKRIT